MHSLHQRYGNHHPWPAKDGPPSSIHWPTSIVKGNGVERIFSFVYPGRDAPGTGAKCNTDSYCQNKQLISLLQYCLTGPQLGLGLPQKCYLRAGCRLPAAGCAIDFHCRQLPEISAMAAFVQQSSANWILGLRQAN